MLCHQHFPRRLKRVASLKFARSIHFCRRVRLRFETVFRSGAALDWTPRFSHLQWLFHNHNLALIRGGEFRYEGGWWVGWKASCVGTGSGRVDEDPRLDEIKSLGAKEMASFQQVREEDLIKQVVSLFGLTTTQVAVPLQAAL